MDNRAYKVGISDSMVGNRESNSKYTVANLFFKACRIHPRCNVEFMMKVCDRNNDHVDHVGRERPAVSDRHMGLPCIRFHNIVAKCHPEI